MAENWALKSHLMRQIPLWGQVITLFNSIRAARQLLKSTLHLSRHYEFKKDISVITVNMKLSKSPVLCGKLSRASRLNEKQVETARMRLCPKTMNSIYHKP